MDWRWTIVLAPLALAACDAGSATTDPTQVALGEASFVVVLNPVVNAIDDASSRIPGPVRANVDVRDGLLGEGGATSEDGVVVLAPLAGGDRALELRGAGIDAAVTQALGERDLVEIAVAADGAVASVMTRVVHPFGREVVALTPEMGISAVNDALAVSDRIVLLGGGVYEGDLVFGGSRVTLFGAGELGGAVVIDGDVIVSGSDNALRGAIVTGALEVSGSKASITFSRVAGATAVSGSDVVLLANDFCAGLSVSGSDTVALGNRGIAPLDGLARCE